MGVIDLVFPRKCFGCGREGKYFCDKCLKEQKLVKPICPMCERASIDGMTHSGCKKPQGLDGLTSIWNYDGAVRAAIISLKYKFAFDIVCELAVHSVENLEKSSYLPKNPVLVPIPTHALRKNWRGFNQAEELGKLIAKEMEWKFIPDLLIKKRLTAPQTELKGKERTENIQGVFALSTHNSSFIIPNSIILFDDVWTTGSTLKEATKVLKRAGAKEVWGLTIAR